MKTNVRSPFDQTITMRGCLLLTLVGAATACSGNVASSTGKETERVCAADDDCSDLGKDYRCSSRELCVQRPAPEEEPPGGPATMAHSTSCDAACCPTDPACYTEGASGAVGAECIAQRDNSLGSTNGNRLQYRSTWARPALPEGFASPIVASVLAQASELPSENCGFSTMQSPSNGSFLQLLDVDLDAGSLRLGYSHYVDAAGFAAVSTSGLCMVDDNFDSGIGLPASQMSPTTGWPEGLPEPMPMADTPWHVAPTRAARQSADFDLSNDRETLLAEIADGSTSGVFYYDDASAYLHAYAPVVYQVIYVGGAGLPSVLPLREAEFAAYGNDGTDRSCIGAYIKDAPCGAADGPTWGCASASCEDREAPATLSGYYLITELEQVFSAPLGVTACIAAPGKQTSEQQGFTGTHCREAPSWNPATPASGLPAGDWCAATNSPATSDCHDAWRSVTLQTHQAFDVREATCNLDGGPTE